MWIRSKNNLELYNTNHVFIYDTKVVCITEGLEKNLGFYNSEDRCIEILDDMQSCITNINGLNSFVYKMPKE